MKTLENKQARDEVDREYVPVDLHGTNIDIDSREEREIFGTRLRHLSHVQVELHLFDVLPQWDVGSSLSFLIRCYADVGFTLEFH